MQFDDSMQILGGSQTTSNYRKSFEKHILDTVKSCGTRLKDPVHINTISTYDPSKEGTCQGSPSYQGTISPNEI